MKKIDLESLKNLLLLNECSILIEEVPSELFDNALSNDCDISMLNGIMKR